MTMQLYLERMGETCKVSGRAGELNWGCKCNTFEILFRWKGTTCSYEFSFPLLYVIPYNKTHPFPHDSKIKAFSLSALFCLITDIQIAVRASKRPRKVDSIIKCLAELTAIGFV